MRVRVQDDRDAFKGEEKGNRHQEPRSFNVGRIEGFPCCQRKEIRRRNSGLWFVGKRKQKDSLYKILECNRRLNWEGET